MDNPNLLNCLILTRNTLPLSFSTHRFIYLPPFSPSSIFLPLSSSLYVHLHLLLPSSLPFSPLSSSFLPTSYLSLYLALPLSSSTPPLPALCLYLLHL